MSYLTHLECTACKKKYDAEVLIGVCECGASIFARYDLKTAKQEITKDYLCKSVASLWRYEPFLPVRHSQNIVTLGEGMTPLLSMPLLGKELGIPLLMVKDEAQNPSSSFKGRGASVSVSRLKELGVSDIVMASSGNAGAAWAAYCKRGGLGAHIFLPVDSSESTQGECSMIGGDVKLFEGHMSRGGQLSGALAKEKNWFEVNTMKEPYRVEGKKTMGYEIVEQLGWKLPDVIIYPTGGGVGIIGMWKAFDELEQLGWIGSNRPKMVSVQYEGCAPLAKAFSENKLRSEPWGEVDIIPGGMRAVKPFADYLLLQVVRESGGTIVTVSKEETYAAWKLVGQSEGLFCSPEGATTIVAASKLKKDGFIKEEDRVVVFSTASGLKYLPLVEKNLPVV